MIDPRELQELPLKELREIKKYLKSMRVPEEYTETLSHHELYVFLEANTELKWDIISNILSKTQPPEIVSILLRYYKQNVVSYLLANPTNDNLWLMIGLQNNIAKQWIRELFVMYFDPVPLLKNLDLQTRDGYLQPIRKKIFFSVKDAIKSNRLLHEDAVWGFEQVYLGQQASPLTAEDSLKLIEMLFAKYPYRPNGLLETSQELKKDLLDGLVDANSPFASLLSINIYGQMCKLFEQESNNSYTQTFIDLYNTLGSYGVHLIKDVWESISLLVNTKPVLKYFPAGKLLEVLIVRVWKHKNDNVPKHCVRDFLKSASIDRLAFLRGYPEVAYHTFTQMLNSGQFYQDSPLLLDSTFYRYVSGFFSEAYAKMTQEELTRHLKLFLESICRWVDYDQALPAFLLVFKQLKQHTQFYGCKQLDLTVELIRKVYYNLHVRKRWQIIDGFLECLRHLSPEVKSEDLLGLVSTIPNEAYGWSFIHDHEVLQSPGSNLLEKYNACYTGDKYRPVHDIFLIRERLEYTFKSLCSKDSLEQCLVNLQEIAFTDFDKIELYYTLLFILQLPYPDLGEQIEELARSCYSNPLQMKLILRHLELQLSRPKPESVYPPNQTLSLLSDFVNRCWKEGYFNAQQLIRTVQLVAKYLLNKTSKLTGEQTLKAGRKDLAQFTEWLTDGIVNRDSDENYALMMNLLLVILKAHCSIPQQQYLIEDCLYDLYSNQLAKLKEIKGIKLRVELFLCMALSNDKTFVAKNFLLREFLKEPVELIDRYDYRQFPELTVFLKRQYIPYALSNGKHHQIDEVQRILKRSLVSNLQYSMQKAEILCYTDFVFDGRLVSDSVLLQEGFVDSWVADSLRVGKDSLVIKRPVIDSLYIALTSNYQRLLEGKLLSRLVGVVLQLARLDQYRGFDGQILFLEEQQKCSNLLALRMKIPPMAEYYGAYPRFLFMSFVDDIVGRSELHLEERSFLQAMVKQVISESIVEDSANKMMFTQPFRLKLRSWQLMQLMVPFVCGDQQMLDWTFEHLAQVLEQSNQPQIKYYTELFVTRVLLSQPRRSLEFVLPKLKESGNSLNNSISYVIIAGLLLERYFNRQVYNVLLTYICANTAYLRGLAQYFCFYNYSKLQTELKQSWVIEGLYEQYRANPDSVRLVTRLDVLISNYKQKLEKWSLEYFCSLYMHKTGETIEEYHMESLKQVGLDIVQEIKQQDEQFLTFKEIWKKEAILPKKSLKQTAAQPPKSFQRKIDPILDDVYDYNDKVAARTKLKILASNLHNLDNYGHLVRTSEIFSVEELAIHDISILEDEKFKSVSCTGEKWLNIKQVPRQEILKYIQQCLQDGYTAVVVLPSDVADAQPIKAAIPYKCLLIVSDDDNYLSGIYRQLAGLTVQLGRDLSIHVQVAIFIWEYVKQHLLGK